MHLMGETSMEALHLPSGPGRAVMTDVPAEMVALADRVRALPGAIRLEIEPILSDAMEEAAFRGRVLALAREALERFRLDLEVIKFDLDQTRLEREALKRSLGIS
jgi:hypothetical protein